MVENMKIKNDEDEYVEVVPAAMTSRNVLQLLGKSLYEHKDNCRDILEQFPDNFLEEVIKHINNLHKNCIGFRVTEYDDFVEEIQYTISTRRLFAKATKLKLDYFCVMCDGECKGHDTKPTENESKRLKLNELSREELINKLMEVL